METTSPELSSALLQWVNSFNLPSPISTWRDLEDGTTLWRILGDIDSEYFHGNLPEVDRDSKDNWIPRWQNLKYIDRMVTSYIRDECDQLHFLSKNLNPDLKAIAIDGAPAQIVKLVKAVLLAAMYSSKSNERMVRVMQTLGAKVALPIAAAIEEMEELDRKLAEQGAEIETGSEDLGHSEDSEAPTRGPSFDRDPELEREERLIQALQEKRRLEAQVADLGDELQSLRERFSTLEEELAEAKFTLDKRRRRTVDEEELEQLSARADRDKDYIAELESELAGAKTTVEQQERQLERLKADDSDKQELRDELQLIRAERDDLRQKAKANENLKKKIQALQEQEKVNQKLRGDLQNFNDQLLELESVKERCAALEKINEENVQAIANGEQEIFDQKTSKKRLEHELKVLAQKFEQTREILSTTQERNRDLEEQLHDYESNMASSIGQLNSLDAELNNETSTATGDDRDRRKSKPPVPLPSSNAEAIALQQSLAIAQASNSRLEQRCLDLLQENLGYKAIVDEQGDVSPESQPFKHQTARLEAVTKDLEDTRSKFIAATTEIAELKHRLETTNGGVVNGESPALAQNQERQKYTELLETELQDQKALLRHTLLSSHALRKENDAIRQSNEYKVVKEQLEVVHSAPQDESEQIIAAAATNLAERIEKERTAAVEGENRISALTAEIHSLTDALRAAKLNAEGAAKLNAEEATNRPASTPATQQDPTLMENLLNLQRENKLITSAWYDLTCRLQSNTVLLARRQEPPKSWLGRQRVAVQQGPSVTVR